MPFETRRRLQAALPQQTATVFRHTAHYPTPSRTNPAPTGAGRNHKGTMMKLKIDIATNNFKHGGGTERYTLDLVKGLNRQNITPAVYATKFDHGIPEYAMIEPHLVDQRRTLKKLRSFLFSSRLAQTRKNSAAKLIACHHADYADLLICGGTHLGYLHHMAHSACGTVSAPQTRPKRNSRRAATAPSTSAYRPPKRQTAPTRKNTSSGSAT